MRGAVVPLVMLLADCDGAGNPIDPEEGAPGAASSELGPSTRRQRSRGSRTKCSTPTYATLACHDPLGQQSGLMLTAGRSFAALVNVASVENPALSRITPNDPANSYLYRKITGAGITGERMPLL